jgi:Uncharacterized protein conserved in bacteria
VRNHYGWGPKSRRIIEIEAGAADWRLLWQVDPDPDAGWPWGDVGTRYFWGRRQDLAAGAFELSRAIAQSYED